jgi:hypothetical protein
LFGPDSIKEAEEKVQVIRERLKAAQSRQKKAILIIIVVSSLSKWVI